MAPFNYREGYGIERDHLEVVKHVLVIFLSSVEIIHLFLSLAQFALPTESLSPFSTWTTNNAKSDNPFPRTVGILCIGNIIVIMALENVVLCHMDVLTQTLPFQQLSDHRAGAGF